MPTIRQIPVVLIVDDEPANRKLLAILVSQEGFEPVTAMGGAEALEILARRTVDLVLLDLMMPEVDGIEVLAELRARRLVPSLPIVVVTAHEDRQIRNDALTAGAIDFLVKPIDRVELRCKLRSLLELSRLRAEAVQRAETAAASDQLARVEAAVAGLPLVIYERGGDGGNGGDWLIGGSEGLHGLTPQEFLADAWFEAVHPDDREQVELDLRSALDGSKPQFTNRFRLRVRGEYRWRLHTASFDSESARLRGVVLSVDEQVGLEEQLLQTQKMEAVGMLAGGIAHDFNNLLAAILAYAGFVRDALPPGDDRRSDVLEIVNAANRGAGLTKQLLTFSRREPILRVPTDLNQSLADLRRLIATMVGQRIELDIVLSAGPAIVRIDPSQFDQLVLNLAVNSRDAMPQGGRLTIVVEIRASTGAGEPARVALTVSDTGVGMEAGTRERVFEPFFTTKEPGRGTGLGLATCFGIVTSAGGSIRVDSDVGRGSTFTIELPSHEGAAHVEPRRDRPRQRSTGGEHVLVAEDEPALRRVAVRVLEGAGYVVHLAADGSEAIEVIDRLGSRLDLVVADIVMPGCGGHEVAEHAARVVPSAGVILTSGYLDESAQSSCRGDLPILWKPVHPEDLLAAVAVALAARLPAEPPGGVVLLVDDDESASRALSRVLDRAGFSTQTATSVAAGRRALERLAPRVILCDLSLADGSGVELLEWIAEVRPELSARVIILTGGAVDRAATRIVESGKFRVLFKPIGPDALLAAIADTPTTSNGKPAPRTAGGRPRVLVVDDDDAIAEIARRVLELGGLDTTLAGTVHAAREALRTEHFDAVLLDNHLPDGTGLDLLAEPGHGRDVPVVMMTGAPSIESAAQAVRSRVTRYLSKPFDSEEVLEAVREAVDAGRVFRVRSNLLASRFGANEFVGDILGTEQIFGRALERIRMVFQPIVVATTADVFGYEALLRCDEPSMGTPARVLEAAEVLGRVLDVGRVVRAAVAATMAAHPTRRDTVFVNLHPTEFRADVLSDSGEPLLRFADRVVLEVTERASLERGPDFDTQLDRIRALGYRVAVDDLGEGYAGLASLVNLRPDFAKIDMSLVRDVHRVPLKRDIVGALVEMCRRSDIEVIAEGIETREERGALVELGCGLLQGYLFAKPGPPFPNVEPELADP